MCRAGSRRVSPSTPCWTSWTTMRVRGRWWRRRWLIRFTASWWGTAKTWKLRGSMWVQVHPSLLETWIKKGFSAFLWKLVASCRKGMLLFGLGIFCFLFDFSQEDKYVGHHVDHLPFSSPSICWSHKSENVDVWVIWKNSALLLVCAVNQQLLHVYMSLFLILFIQKEKHFKHMLYVFLFVIWGTSPTFWRTSRVTVKREGGRIWTSLHSYLCVESLHVYPITHTNNVFLHNTF